MSAVSTSAKIKSSLAVGALVLSLAASTGQLTAASFTGGGNDESAVSAAVAAKKTTETPIYADDKPEVFARAGAARDSLGFPKGATRTGRHVHDGNQNTDYDEVDEVDAGGHPVALTQHDSKGRLVTAVRFDMPAGLSTKVNGDQAATAARTRLVQAGLTPVGQARVDENPAANGWDIHWDRSEAGYRVRGDETAAHVWQDGRVQSVAHVEHDLAAAPANPLVRAKAQDAVARQFDSWFAGRNSGYTVQAMNLEWVGPNATFDTAKLGAAPAPYRLAWVADVKPSGSAAEVVRLITLYVDAGDGTVIGGDVVE